MPKRYLNCGLIHPQSRRKRYKKATRLFRAFGEDYHERKLEEAYIFPAVKKAGGAAGVLPDILVTQHNRGREITEYIIGVTGSAKVGATNAESPAQALADLRCANSIRVAYTAGSVTAHLRRAGRDYDEEGPHAFGTRIVAAQCETPRLRFLADGA